MFNIFTILPLVFLVLCSYMFNRKKLSESRTFLLGLSLFEGLVSYFFIYLLFLEGHIPYISLFFIFVFVLALITYIASLFQKELDNEIDLQIETIKNTLIVFFLTLSPLYLSLTIFRFQPVVLQVLYSVLVVFLLVLLKFVTSRKMETFKDSFKSQFTRNPKKSLILLGTSLGLLILFIAFFNIPLQGIKQRLNLSNPVSYLANDGLPTDMANNFKHTTPFKEKANEITSLYIQDAYFHDDTMYLQIQDKMYSLDAKSGDIMYSQDGFNSNPAIKSKSVKHQFFTQNDRLYFLSNNDLYELSREEFVLIHQFDATETQIYEVDHQPHFLVKEENLTYRIHQMENNQIKLLTTIDFTVGDNSEFFKIIDQSLFYLQGDVYIDYHHEDTSIPGSITRPIYDGEHHLLYYTFYDEDNYETFYTQVQDDQTSKELKRQRLQNLYGFTSNGYVFYYPVLNASNEQSLYYGKEFHHIDIMDHTFKFQAVQQLADYKTFFFSNTYTEKDILSYQTTDKGFGYLQIDKNSDTTLLTYHLVEEKETGLDASFYSHHALWMFIPTLLAFFFPLTNYREHITFLGYQENINKHRKEQNKAV